MKLSYRTAGWSAISSGITGIMAILLLIGYLSLRGSSTDNGEFLTWLYSAGVLLEFTLLIPAIIGLYQFSQRMPPGISKALFNSWIGSIFFVIISLLLLFPKIVSDVFYMFPEGVFGGLLIACNLRLQGLVPRGLLWLGMVVGAGFILLGMFPLGFALFVDKASMQIPAVAPKEFPMNSANVVLHYFLFAGSIMGVLLLPLWAILIGRKLLKEIITT
ncbi:MAG: hypothetical protein ABIN67_14420 [Ferruginibacter sp.]